MKRLIAAMLIAATMCLSGCGNSKNINGKEAETFGFANQEANRRDDVVYEVSFGSVICAIIFCETMIVPIYIVGWDLWEPVRAK